jgi:ribonuclease D
MNKVNLDLITNATKSNIEQTTKKLTDSTVDISYVRDSLESIPREMRLEKVCAKDDKGLTMLHKAANDPDLLKLILGYLPEEHRLDAVKVIKNFGVTVLHMAKSNIKSLNAILESLPYESRLDAVKIANNYGDSVLHWKAKNSEALKAILERLPERHRIKAVLVANNHGSTVLHWAAKSPESLKVILDLLYEDQRFEAVTIESGLGCTVLHKAAEDIESIKVILERLPLEQRLQAIQVKEKRSGRMVFDLLNQKRDLLPIILKDITAHGLADIAKVFPRILGSQMNQQGLRKLRNSIDRLRMVPSEHKSEIIDSMIDELENNLNEYLLASIGNEGY